ncbi:AraC family transcriptional regulator [Caballeronia novacaledonica]|uniref:AraC family transcriptional regulator n=1 Tax=Caballeronia novacaledonica TaxID=1544861 RepID=A0A2U3HY57_9BURK|nr:AraC family transcriptional regulator [Caballeronia novacaledonica]SPB12731.1 AraC family transcriptional regulator [Caballeronia novacaledonica]
MTTPAQTENGGAPKLVSIDEIVDILSHRPTASTRARGWSGVTVDLYRPLKDCSERYPALDHHLICYCPSGHARLIQGRDGAVHEGIISTGVSLLMPAGCDSLWEGDAAASARLRIPTSLIASAADEIGRRSIAQVEVRNVFETRDAVIAGVAQILLGELEREPHPAQALIVDHASCVLAAHLLRSYNAFEPVRAHEPPSLGKAELARLSAYIEDNLDRTIGLAELAAIANVSRFHFARLFKRATGVTAIGFVEQCRVRRAQTLIAETGIALAEIALMTGFADQSHFTRRFHRHVGCTPATYAREQGRRRARRRGHE